ncbi:carotenoid oxygenase family protein [Scytonema sp. PRP1]|uniref:carotenoid oxygenase family protein n=1 Tax=Scytonema sp. PRP1 TaxID=3120513 RepID=UPI002FD1BCD5
MNASKYTLKAIKTASSQQDAGTRDRFSQGKPLWARALAQSSLEFGPTPLRIISGKVPMGLRGTFYQNGAGLLERGGQRLNHWFDGDGGILAVHFTDQGAIGLYRYVKTSAFEAEQRAGKFLYPGFGQKALLGGGILRKNPANTAVLAFQNKLLALWEIGSPYVLDPETLETLGVEQFNSLTKTKPFSLASWLSLNFQPFSAHPKQDPTTGQIYNFGVSYGVVPKINLYKMSSNGHIRRQAKIPLGRFSMLHDFCLAGNYLIFFVPPIEIDISRVLLGLKSPNDSIEWHPHLGTDIIIVDCETLQEVGRYQTEAWYQLHIINGYVDKDGSAVIDFVRYPDLQPNQLFAQAITGCLDTSLNGKPWRLRLNPKNGQVSENIQLLDLVCEFPKVSPFELGSTTRRMYLNACVPDKAKIGNDIFNTIVCLNADTGKITLAQPGSGCYPTEPIYVPDRFTDNEGWILSVVFDGNQDKSTVHIYDAKQLEQEPVCVLELPHIVPFGFHGTWRTIS